MTRSTPEHPPKKKHATGHKHPLRKRLIVLSFVLVLALAGFVTMFDRKDLPGHLKDNAYVAKLYNERDAAVAATSALIDRHEKKAEEPADANADMKQQGYNKDDRKKLEAIITNQGSKTE